MSKKKVMYTLFLLIAFILLVMISPKSYAAKNEIIKVSMNGSSVQVREVPIILNGQAVLLEDPSFIHIDRTLVPLRFVAESFGAEVDWVQKTKTAIVTLNDKKINLTIDSPDVTINLEKVKLDKNSIPKLVTFANKEDAKTMVPMAFISTILGYEVGYNEETREPFINGEKTPEVEDEVIELNPETNVDKDKDKDKELEVETDKDKDKDKDKEPEKDTEEDKDKDKVEDKFIIISPEEMKTLNNISDIYLDRVNGKDVIVVNGTKDSKYKITKLKNPERLVIDILDAAFISGQEFQWDYDIGFVKKVRASQFAGDNNSTPGQRIVRVVLDAKVGESNPDVNVEVDNGKLLIYPKKSIWENIKYDSTSNKISLLLTDRTIYNLSYDVITKTIDCKNNRF